MINDRQLNNFYIPLSHVFATSTISGDAKDTESKITHLCFEGELRLCAISYRISHHAFAGHKGEARG